MSKRMKKKKELAQCTRGTIMDEDPPSLAATDDDNGEKSDGDSLLGIRSLGLYLQ